MKKLKKCLFNYMWVTLFCMVVGLVFLLPACFSKDDIKNYTSTAQQPFFLMNTGGNKDPCLGLYTQQDQHVGDISGLIANGNICHFFPQDQKVRINALTVVDEMWIKRILALNVQDAAMKKPIFIQISPAEQHSYTFKIYWFFITFFPMLFYLIWACYRGIQALLGSDRI